MEEKKYLLTITDSEIIDISQPYVNLLDFHVTDKEKDLLIQLAREMKYKVIIDFLEDK